ncbi:hypothetical protein SAMN05444366_4184 [Flavobacterium saccharophilum]|uniref:Uncharacterized protein n=2 Tax=Flavobacterium saccharophilum TaxID=29534 RepID=A0A1M7LNJ4_9FLAO|nr:hypothetical protein SAMN05444366_4184 [Flavobacterium saccharophilum]
MQMKKYRGLLVFVVFFVNTVVVLSQNEPNEKMLNEFVRTVFYRNTNAKFIADNFIYFGSINNSKYTIDDRIKILDKHLKKIKKEKGPLLDPANFSIVTYNEFKGSKINFSNMSDYIFVLVSKNNPVMYFNLRNGKIFAFDYIIKGDEGLFITY